MIHCPGDDLTREEITKIAVEAGKATFDAVRASMVLPDLNGGRVFELIFNAMIVSRGSEVTPPPASGEGHEESVS